MFFYTDTAGPPWIIVKSDGKKRARLACMQHFLSSLPYLKKDGIYIRCYTNSLTGPHLCNILF